jgi:ABC-2 type transport system permease protein
MLIYVPTITMGVWAEERKQGTDELLLTIPARDFDVVMGKYLAAVAIFSVSLVFSLACNYLVLNNLASKESGLDVVPRIDIGLFFSTYFGYWLIGLAMLAIGVVASFLTSNITIGFVLGVLFNMPLVFLSSVQAVFGGVGRQALAAIKSWSIPQQFSDFSRGVLTLEGTAYFVAILVVMLYVSMVLIGRRHWLGGGKRPRLVGRYCLRTVALAVTAAGAVVVFSHHDARLDATVAQLSSLSSQTRELLRDLKVDRPVQIDAFVSPTVPEAYVQTRLNLLSALKELRAAGGGKLQVQIHDAERYSAEAVLAEKRYGIEPRQVTTLDHGALTENYIFLHVVVKCGTRKVAPAFIDRDVPVEYELVRSICAVGQQKRKRLGALNTDVQLFGGFNMQNFSSIPQWPIVDELEKQYEVVKVDPSKPIAEKFDVLLAVQPSSLGQPEMDNFVAAVEGGQPTVIFEDPCPVFAGNVPATSAPRQPPGGMNPMMMRAPPPEKGDVGKLWKALGVDVVPNQIVWQDYNPYPKIPIFAKNKEFVFVDAGCGAKEPFSLTDPIASGLQQVLFPFSGYVAKLNVSNLAFTPLVRTGERTGMVLYGEIMQASPFGPRGDLNPERRQIPTGLSYILAAHVQGKKLNAVLVADIDMLSPLFFRLREQGEIPELGVHLDFDNVTLSLNAIDELAGDKRFIEIRKRRPQHRTLVRIEERTKEAKQEAANLTDQFIKDYEAQEQKLEQEIADAIAELKKQKDIDPQQLVIKVALEQQYRERQRQAKVEQLREEKKRKTQAIETDLKQKVDAVQGQYKLWAVLLPPIPPLLVAVIVFFTRRAREREGVAQSRLR